MTLLAVPKRENPSIPNLATVSQCPQHRKLCELSGNRGLSNSAVSVFWDSLGQSQKNQIKWCNPSICHRLSPSTQEDVAWVSGSQLLFPSVPSLRFRAD